MLRSLIAMLLSCLLLACPLLCGADELGHGARCDRPTCDEGQDGPDPCPDGGDSCVCRGAVQPANFKALASNPVASPPCFPLAIACPVFLPRHHLAQDGAPAGLAGRGDALTIRAYLQNFRF